MYITESTGSFETTPAGAFVARCYRLIDLGTQVVTWQGESKEQHKISIGWELPTELMLDGRPFSAHETYTWSFHEKAKLRGALESWRGRKFGEADFNGPNRFDTRMLLGMACLLTIIHEEGKTGGVWARVAGISPLPRGMEVPPAVNEPLYLSLLPDRWDAATFSKLSSKMQEKIKLSPEYHRLHATKWRTPDPIENILDDEIPFGR